ASSTKTYDGTTTSSAVPSISGGLVAGDAAAFTESFDTRHAGTGKTLTASGSVSDGNNGNNYALTFVIDTTGRIAPKAITVTASTSTRGYDGTTTSSAIPTVTGGLVSGDSAAFTESFDTRHTGTGKTVTPTGAVNDGNSGGNYAVTFVATATGQIAAR